MKRLSLSLLGNNPARSRIHNRHVIFETLRLHGPLGRLEIAQHTKLTLQAVANIVQQLCDDAILIQIGKKETVKRGKPPIQFGLNQHGIRTIGLEVKNNQINALVVDLTGAAHNQLSYPLKARSGKELAIVVKQALITGGFDKLDRPVMGVGIAISTDLVKAFTEELVTLFQKSFSFMGLPVVLETEVGAMAAGELFHGIGRHTHNFCCLHIGSALDLATVKNGRLLPRALNNAGSIGALPCTWSNKNNSPFLSLDDKVSLTSLREHLNKHGKDYSNITVERLFAERNPAVVDWLIEAAHYLCHAVNVLDNVLGPEAIIISGDFPPALLADLSQRVNRLRSTNIRSVGPRARVQAYSSSFLIAQGAANLPLL